MIRGFHLADFLTLGNAACGVVAIFAAMAYLEAREAGRLLAATALLPLALVFDVLDGRVARARRAHSALGRELDSLADVISFGVAPAAIAYAAGMNAVWDVVILVYFVCCGVSRLARFNVTAETLAAHSAKVAYFEGTPIPTSVVGSIGIVDDQQNDPHPQTLMDRRAARLPRAATSAGLEAISGLIATRSRGAPRLCRGATSAGGLGAISGPPIR